MPRRKKSWVDRALGERTRERRRVAAPYVDERDPVEEFVQRIFSAPQIQDLFDRAGEMIDDAGRIFDPDFVAEAAASAARRAAPRGVPGQGQRRPPQAPPRRPPPHQAPPPRPATPPPPPAAPRRTARDILHFDEVEILTREAIEQRRRDMAKIFHPDRQGGSTKAMQAINAAADELLGDPRTRP